MPPIFLMHNTHRTMTRFRRHRGSKVKTKPCTLKKFCNWGRGNMMKNILNLFVNGMGWPEYKVSISLRFLHAKVL